MQDIVTAEKFNQYHQLTSEALAIAKQAPISDDTSAKEIFSMVNNYLHDATYFFEKKDLVRAFGAVNYAHGWLDCGARLKIFEVSDNHYFTEDGED